MLQYLQHSVMNHLVWSYCKLLRNLPFKGWKTFELFCLAKLKAKKIPITPRWKSLRMICDCLKYSVKPRSLRSKNEVKLNFCALHELHPRSQVLLPTVSNSKPTKLCQPEHVIAHKRLISPHVQSMNNSEFLSWRNGSFIFLEVLCFPAFKGGWSYFGPDIINYVFYSRWKGIIRTV